MTIKYPLGCNDYIERASEYASKSMAHTHDYAGFQDRDTATLQAKHQRIKLGVACQFLLHDVFTLNGLDSTLDNSHYSKADEFDVLVNGYRLDCKQSTLPDLWPQVTMHADRADVDGYVFFLTDEDMSYIQPRGTINTDNFHIHKVKLEQGDTVPGTEQWPKPLLCKMDYSYFVNPEHLKPFECSVINLRSMSKK